MYYHNIKVLHNVLDYAVPSNCKHLAILQIISNIIFHFLISALIAVRSSKQSLFPEKCARRHETAVSRSAMKSHCLVSGSNGNPNYAFMKKSCLKNNLEETLFHEANKAQ
jgi:hypothetical protein